MRAILAIELVAPRSQGADYYDAVNLVKELDIPFVPSPGHIFVIPIIESGHPNSRAYRELIDKVETPVTGCLTLDRVYYHILSSHSELRVFENYESLSEMAEAVDQYVIGYGFDRQE